MRASISAQHGDANVATPIFYEARHVILSTIGHVRVTALMDARRASSGLRTVLRDGTVSECRRFQNLLETSWFQCGFLEQNHTLRFSISWPIPVNLDGFQRASFPSRGRLHPPHIDFVY
jgi:hypothetical protein